MSKYTPESLVKIFKDLFHGYEYTINDYKNNKQKIEIICDKGYIFEMSVSQHLKGYKCPYCLGSKISNLEILSEVIETHKNKYVYPDFSYDKLDDEIKIICPEHGLFTKSIKLHRRGSGCSKCSMRFKKTNYDFIEFCLKIDNKLNYSQVNYINNKQKVNIICKDHGVISISPNQIINQVKKTGQICSSCHSYNRRFESFLKKARIKYGNKFRYYEFVDDRTKMKIENIETGFIFYQTPRFHITCNYFYDKRDINDFIKKSNDIHGNRYQYNKSVYVGNKDKISIYCKNHGYFSQIVNNHLRGAGCPKCNRFNIKESSLYEFIRQNYKGDIKLSDRTILNGKELDIYIPDLNLSFEFNGLYWHSELYKDKKYHIDKTNGCLKNGINLIHIWEDDWDNKNDIAKSIILNKLGNSERIFARRCYIKTVNSEDSRLFLNSNHIQGFVGSKIRLGLYYNDELVSLMTFGSLRKSLGQKSINNVYELLRFCNKKNTSVVGGASRLFKYFLSKNEVDSVVSYSDSSRGFGNLYKELGFKFIHDSVPNYYYIIEGVRKHRFNFRKDKLVKEGSDPNKTEIEIMSDRGIYRIFDCGSKKWVFENLST